jgi:cytochrome c-type biogenesis protein CcmH
MTRHWRWAPWAVLIVVAGVALAFGLSGRSSPPTLESRVEHIAGELRCPTCNGETVAESSSTVSVQIRAQIRQELLAGESDQQIVEGLEADYGTFILEKPPAHGVGLLVWVLPVVGAIAGVSGLTWFLRRGRRSGTADGEPAWSGRPAVEVVQADSEMGLDGVRADSGSGPADPEEVTPAPTRRRARTALLVSGVLLIAGGAGWAVAGSTGQRLPGQPITGAALGPQEIEDHLNQAASDELKNPPDVAGAVKEYQAVLDAQPNQIDALTGEGWLLAETGQPSFFQQGLSLLSKAELVDPSYPPAHLYRGLALLGEDNFSASIAEFQWYLDHSPDPTVAPAVKKALAEAEAGQTADTITTVPPKPSGGT